MKRLDVTLSSIGANVALDEALLLDAEAGGPEVLRLWEWPRLAVVLGAAGRLALEIDDAACRADDVPIARRSSGGGAVMLGPGCLLFSVVLRFERDPALADLHASYRFILGKLQRTLTPLLQTSEEVVVTGLSDLALGIRKISGNAQQRKRTHLLHHGSLLYGFDATMVERYLRMPPRQPEYRQLRSHVDFMTNLPIESSTLKSKLAEIWDANDPMTDWPTELTNKLLQEKYETAEWIHRR